MLPQLWSVPGCHHVPVGFLQMYLFGHMLKLDVFSFGSTYTPKIFCFIVAMGKKTEVQKVPHAFCKEA